jgi:hypothetical protein
MPPATGHYCENCGQTIGYPGKCADCLAKSRKQPPLDPPKRKENDGPAYPDLPGKPVPAALLGYPARAPVLAAGPEQRLRGKHSLPG